MKEMTYEEMQQVVGGNNQLAVTIVCYSSAAVVGGTLAIVSFGAGLFLAASLMAMMDC